MFEKRASINHKFRDEQFRSPVIAAPLHRYHVGPSHCLSQPLDDCGHRLAISFKMQFFYR